MSGDSNGVVVYRTTRLSMIEAVRSAHPAPAGRLRRNKRLSHAELADAILATLPEAEPDPLKAVEAAERIIAARDAEIELMRRDFRSAEKLIGERDAEITRKNGRCDDLFATGRRKDEQIEELGQEAKTSEALIETLRAELAEAEAGAAALQARCGEYENAIAWNTSCTACARTLDSSIAEHERADKSEQAAVAMKAALERFAAPGAITATDRRKAASDALGAAQGDAEATP